MKSLVYRPGLGYIDKLTSKLDLSFFYKFMLGDLFLLGYVKTNKTNLTLTTLLFNFSFYVFGLLWIVI